MARLIADLIIRHDPEQYALDNYEKALAHLDEGAAFTNTNTPPNLKYIPWTIDSLVEALDEGKPSIMDGDWTG